MKRRHFLKFLTAVPFIPSIVKAEPELKPIMDGKFKWGQKGLFPEIDGVTIVQTRHHSDDFKPRNLKNSLFEDWIP